MPAPNPGPPMTLGGAAEAGVRLIVWCKACQHQVEPDPTEMAARYSADSPVLDWKHRLLCSRCGSREVDMVLTGKCFPPAVMQPSAGCVALTGATVVPKTRESLQGSENL
jgi:hypothetical protein